MKEAVRLERFFLHRKSWLSIRFNPLPEARAQVLARAKRIKMDPKLPDLNEIKVRPGLTIVRCETIGKLFVRETWQRLEDLPAETRQEIEEFLISPEKRKGDR